MGKCVIIDEKRLNSSFLILYPWYYNGTIIVYKYSQKKFFLTKGGKNTYNLHSLRQNKTFHTRKKNGKSAISLYRRVVETMIQKSIPEGLEVHHIDCNHSNNNPENLLIVSNKEHQYLHCLLKKAMVDAINTKNYAKFDYYKNEINRLKAREF